MNAISKKLLSFVIVLAMVLSMAPVITLPAAAATDPQTIIETANSAAFAANFANGGTVENVVCPVCGTAQTWTAVGSGSISTTSTTSADAKHFYISASYTYTGATFINVGTSGVKPCVYLNGQTVTLTKATMLVNNGVNLIGGTGKIIRQDGDATNGLFRTSGSGGTDGIVSIYGGTYEDYDENAPLFRDSTKNTWNFYGATFAFKGKTAHELFTKTSGVAPYTLHSGTIDCGVGTFTVTNGVSINLDGGTFNGTLNMNAGDLTIGSANVTGSVNIATGATITLTGAPTITGGGLTLGTDVYADVTDLATTSGAIAVNGALGDKIAVNGDATKAAMFTAPTGLAVTADGTDLVLSEAVVEPELPDWDSDIPTRINQWTETYGAQFTGEYVETAICPICGDTDVNWRPVTSGRLLPSLGDHLYLANDITAGSLDQIGTSHAAPHCIYLNNYTYTSEGTFAVRDTLNIFDNPNVAGGGITDANSTNATATYEKNPSFRLFGGAKLNIYYGAYTCAQAKYTNTSDTVVNPNGTPLIGSYADGAQAYIYGATLQNTGYGEVLRAEHNVTVELENCELKGGSGYVDGEGVSYGGNIYMEDGTVTLKNTTVTGGTATNGSVYVGGGTLKLAGTTSIAANGLTLGTDVYADVTNLTAANGAIVVNGTKDQKIAVNGNADKAAMFTAPEGLEVTVEGTDLVLTEPEVADPGPDYSQCTTTLDKINKFTAYYAEKFAAGGTVETTDCPVCGATSVTWRAKSSGSFTAQTVDEVQVATHYYLAASWERSTSQQQLGDSHSAPVCVYLNGNTFKTEGRFLVKDQLNIFDNAANAGGIIKPTHDKGSESYTKVALFDVYSGELNIYGGQYDSQQANVIAGQNDNGTPVIESHHSDSVVNIYGGTFKNTGVGTVIDLSNGAVTMTGGTLQGGNGYIDGENKLGGNVYISGGTFTLNGGDIENGTATSGGNVYVAADGTLAMNNGTITGGKANDTDYAVSDVWDGGGNVFNGGTFTMTDGLITLGEATYDGGNVFNYRATGKECTLSGGSITEGVATNGGNLYGRLATTLSGVTISGGEATNGGNLYTRASRITMSGGSVSGGEATNGGNAYIYAGSSSALRLTGGSISGGTATNGGNIYVGGNSATLDLRSGTVTGGVAGVDAEEPTEPGTSTGVASNGGSVYVAEEGIFNMTGGSITGGTVYPRLTAKADGSGITVTYGNGGSVYVAGTLNMSNGTITGGTARDARGSGVYVNGKAYLSGGTINGTNDVTDSALHVTGGSSLVSLSGNVNITADNGKAIRVISSGTLNIEPTWSGKAYAMIYSSAGWDMGAKIGKTENEVFTVDYVQSGTYTDGVWSPCGEGNYFSGSLYQYTNNGSKLFALADGSLQAAGGAYVAGDDTVWCRDANAAIEQALAAASYDYLWLSGEATLNGETITVDISGSQDASLSGTGYVNGIDLANTDYKTNSAGLDIDPLSADTIKVNGEYEFDGKRYIALNQDAWTFHCLDLKLSAITLRPNKDNNNGLYYKSTITCDPALAGAVKVYGVAVNKSGVLPGKDFAEHGDQFSWTEITKALAIDDTKTTVTVNSALVKGILKDTREPAKNVAAGNTQITANAYLAIDTDGDGGLEFYMASNPKSYSLFDVLSAINTNWSAYAANHAGIGGFYKHWSNYGLNAWDGDLADIAAYAATLQN